jgi:uncharacterized protein
VWFFSLDAGNPLAAAIARAWFHLPYFCAQMICAERQGWIHYQSERSHRGAPTGFLEGRYRPVDEVFSPRPGALEHFLTERYCLYAADAREQIIRGGIHHPRWPLQLAEADFRENTMAEAVGVTLPLRKPLLHFSRRQDVVVWRPELLV